MKMIMMPHTFYHNPLHAKILQLVLKTHHATELIMTVTSFNIIVENVSVGQFANVSRADLGFQSGL